ncbi:MAG TPA: flagellar hook-associated protein FlgL [Epulopiscium sp.]|nr:flagellar hook-associated protein FlgL [Candidatus Epulonipiscium sp.]
MRVTNAMLSNNMVLGLNKNMNKLNTLYDQVSSLKKIQRPSDDPIILGRSLKLRLNVLETEQYKTNVGEARSWMQISGESISNTHEIINDIRYQCVQASNGPLGTEDRKKILATVEQLKKQLVQESNADYAGRNVFAGYKTDKKVLFDENTKMDEAIEFEQTFTKDNVETVTYREKEYYRIRLPYGEVDAGTTSITGINVVDVVDSTDEPPVGPPIGSFYHPAAGEAYFLQDTGELIINKTDYANMAQTHEIRIEYEKTNFKEGDPNPEVFFDVQDPEAADPIYTDLKLSQKLEYEIGIGTKLDINVLGKNLFDPLALRDIDELVHMLQRYEDIEEDINGKEPSRHYNETINLSKLFSNGIGAMDKALKVVSEQQADLGSRIKRLELTEKRLGDDEISYTELLSRTEDIELEKAYIDFNTQYAVYQSALQVTARVVQPTLMDFLR